MNESHPRPVALITGAASGIGREIARQLAAAGYAIAALDCSADGLQALERDLGEHIASAVANVTDRASLQVAVTTLEEQLGAIDLLVASAGVGRESSGLHFDAADFEDIIEVNLVGVANSVGAVLRGMVKRRRGQIVALSSLASYHGLPFMAGYCASKAGLNALMDSLRVELEPCGITCTTVCPGWTKTPMTANLRMPIPDMMEVETAVRRIVQAIQRRERFVAFPGRQARRVRLLRWLPTRWGDRLVQRMIKSLSR